MGRVSAAVAVVALVTAAAATASPWRVHQSDGVSLRLPPAWSEVSVAPGTSTPEAQTILVAGTDGAQHRKTPCLVASYRVPVDGAVVVVIGRRGTASAAVPTDRSEFEQLRLQREYLSCFDGRAGVAQIALNGRSYQVSVLVGDRAGAHIVIQALAVARSFGLASE